MVTIAITISAAIRSALRDVAAQAQHLQVGNILATALGQ